MITDNPKTLTKINTPREKLPWSPIHPLIPKINPEPYTKAKHILIAPSKLEPSPQSKISRGQQAV